MIKDFIDFSKISPKQFEELCFELILSHGFTNIIWRQGGADSGRDIEANTTVTNSLVGSYEQKFFFECKHHSKGISPDELSSKITWADAEKPDHLVFIASSYFSNGCLNWIEKIRSQKPYKIHLIQNENLRHIVSQHEDIISKYFLSNKLTQLLEETIKNWIIHDIIPNFQTYQYLLEQLDLESLSISKATFLYSLYYAEFGKLEELENEVYHGYDITDEIEVLEKRIINYEQKSNLLFDKGELVDALSEEGYLGRYEEDDNSKYNFIASKLCLKNSGKSSTYILAHYVFKRIGEMAIELILYQNSSLTFRIKIYEKYEPTIYKNALESLNFKEKYIYHILGLSENMK